MLRGLFLLFSFDFHDDTDKLCLAYAVKYPADIIGKTLSMEGKKNHAKKH